MVVVKRVSLYFEKLLEKIWLLRRLVSQNTLKTLGPAPALQTSSFDRKCKLSLRWLVGAARGPIRRNRSNQLKTGPDWEPNSAKGFAPPRKLL